MEKFIYYLVALLVISVSSVSCSDDETMDERSLAIMAFYPTIVLDNVEVTITGSAMETVDQVVFPGGVIVNDVVHVDNQTIKVLAPAGVSEEETPLTLKAGEAEVTSRQTIRRATPVFTFFQFAESSGAVAGTGMAINGNDLLLVEKVIFTLGESSSKVEAMDFIRKSNSAVKVIIPDDAPVGKGVMVALEFQNGATMDLEEVEILRNESSGYWDTKELPIYSDGDKVIGNWDTYLKIAQTPFGNAKVDDVMRVYFTESASDAQGSLKNGSTWAGLATDLEYFDITANAAAGYYECIITEDILVQLQASGVVVSGKNHTIKKITLVTSVWIEGDKPLTDPITEATIMLNDFEAHDGHNSGWDKSWTDATATEFPVDDNGNTYLHWVKTKSDAAWLINCNHQNIGTVSGIENYAIKFDLLIDDGTTGASNATMQFVLNGNWIYVGTNFFPETTGGKWITVAFNLSDIKPALQGGLTIDSSNTTGIYGSGIPAGICIDNYRLDPKQ